MLLFVQVILVGGTLEDTFQAISQKYGEDVLELRTIGGAVIDEVSLLR